MGVVGEIDRAHLDHRVVVDEPIQPTAAEDERGHDLAAVPLLAGTGDHAGLHEVDDAVREHLAVDAEVPLVEQEEGGRGGDRPDAKLDRGAIGHEISDVLADSALHLPDLPDGMLVRGLVDLDGHVDVADMDEAVAERPRHRSIELDDDAAGRPDRRMHRFHGRSKRAEAERVRGRGVDEHGVERQSA